MIRDEIRDFVLEREIEYLVHFTQANNLPSIMKYGLCSVDYLNSKNIEYRNNDQLRLDKRTDYVSLSIQFPNYKMFYRYRRNNENSEWAVLSIDKSVLWKKDCAFCKTNAANIEVSEKNLDSLKDVTSLKEMFADLPGKYTRNEMNLSSGDPTDVQAEVLVFEKIEPEFIFCVTFEDEALKNKYEGLFIGKEVKLTNKGKGFFASRGFVRNG